jgi:hypothetical protein
VDPDQQHAERRQPGEEACKQQGERERRGETVAFSKQREVPRSPHDTYREPGRKYGVTRAQVRDGKTRPADFLKGTNQESRTEGTHHDAGSIVGVEYGWAEIGRHEG